MQDTRIARGRAWLLSVPTASDRVFWLALRRCWPRWKETLAMVQPETVIRWHREGFRRYWRWKSRRRAGQPSTTAETRALVRRIAAENPTWAAPRIHGEILKLGLRLLACFASYYLDDRTHLSLKKDAAAMRAVETKPDPAAEVIALPRLGGLHHRYAWRRAA